MPFERVANSCRPLDQPPHRTARYRRCCLAILRGACPMPAARTGLSLLELESSRITLAGRWASPARLFKQSTLAALRRVKQLFLSVGVGPVHSATGS